MTTALYVIRASAFANPDIPTLGLDDIEFKRRASALLSALRSGSLYWPGQIAITAGEVAPTGWLVCDGSAVARDALPALWNVLGTRYGAGDGLTTFNLPTQTQAASIPPDVPPSQTVVGGAVSPSTPVVIPPVTENPVGGSGSGSVVGGRPPKLGEFERER